MRSVAYVRGVRILLIVQSSQVFGMSSRSPKNSYSIYLPETLLRSPLTRDSDSIPLIVWQPKHP